MMKSRKMYSACVLGVLLIGLFLWEGNLIVKGGDSQASNEKRLEDAYRTRPLSLKDDQIQYDCADEDGLSVNVIEEYSDSAGGERYVIVFSHGNVVYTVGNLESLAMAKRVANSFVKE